MNIYDVLYMLAAIEILTPEPTFFKRRYFPTDLALDVFGTSKVLADYKEGNRKAAPFVLPRVDALPVGRGGFSTFELEPGNIAISKLLTIDQLHQRGFGESILSNVTPEQRARQLLMGDLSDLSARISRREEWLACETMLKNGCVMRHQTSDPAIYEDISAKFYDGTNNPAQFTPAATWTHGKDKHTPGNWYWDVIQMVKMLTQRGRAATDLVVSNDVGNFLMEDPWIQYMMAPAWASSTLAAASWRFSSTMAPSRTRPGRRLPSWPAAAPLSPPPTVARACTARSPRRRWTTSGTLTPGPVCPTTCPPSSPPWMKRRSPAGRCSCPRPSIPGRRRKRFSRPDRERKE